MTRQALAVGGIEVLVERKRVKHLRLRVYPPDGEVRVSAPLRTPLSEVEAAVEERLDWIAEHRQRFRRAQSAASLEYVSGEVHYLRGEALTLRLEPAGAFGVSENDDGNLVLRAPPSARLEVRAAALERWYRAQAQSDARALVSTWSLRMGLEMPLIGLKRMRSRWGTCNPATKRVWLNTELVKRPPRCYEYVVVHELAHVVVPHHGPEFWALVSRHLPGWRAARAELERWPTWAHGRLP